MPQITYEHKVTGHRSTTRASRSNVLTMRKYLEDQNNVIICGGCFRAGGVKLNLYGDCSACDTELKLEMHFRQAQEEKYW